MMPFFFALVVALITVTVFSDLVLFLPRILMN
jgi:TRAP-type C4-dicarboxylate transport system permease large subunit